MASQMTFESRRHFLMLGALAAAVMATVYTSGYLIFVIADDQPIMLLRTFVWAWIDWSTWIWLVPFALAIVRWAPLDRGSSIFLPATVHLASALAAPLLWSALLTLLCVVLEAGCRWLGIDYASVLPDGARINITALQRFEGISVSKGAQNVIMFGVVLAMIYAGRAAARRRAEEQRLAAETARRTADELSATQRQVNVELVASALEAIAGHAETDPERAEAAALSLARLMRAATGRQGPLVPLRQELAIAASYLELLGVNAGTQGATLDAAAIEPALADVPVPTFAIPAAIDAAGVGPGRRVAVTARRAADSLVLDISGGEGAQPQIERLTALRDRWRQLFGDADQVDFDGTDLSPTVRLRVPIAPDIRFVPT